ncbi:MAG: CD225/dispanin family protein [Fimbriimonadaceae bacterium]|nr:CD225/dispanin family protein [Fimbriimonadaceae bacterium]
MFRIDINGTTYIAPDLATLQQWANEGRVLPATTIYIQSENRQLMARDVPGLVFGSGYATPPRQEAVSYPRQGYMTGEKVQNYLVYAILTTLCCCMPFGIVSIVYAAQVDGFAARGEMARATEASDKAKNWAIASAVGGLIASGLWLALGTLSGGLR